MTKPTKRSGKGRKMARRMWADRGFITDKYGRCAFAVRQDKGEDIFIVPLFVLSAAPEDVEAMREAAHAAVCNEFTSPKGPPGLKDYSDSVLRALGLLTPAKKTKAL